jgi:MoaA/NifB/PqqE/SkfB family radical SAM enzyme
MEDSPMPSAHRNAATHFKNLFRAKKFDALFLFVTSRCNSRCRTCFYWDNLNKNEDLTFDQLETVSRTAPDFGKLWLSGGEPFLRTELDEIIGLFYRRNRIRHLNLPTNGLLPERTESVIARVLRDCPELTIDLNFSIDGLANTHDAIRGVPNNFEKTLETIERLARFRGRRRLRRNVVTVITRENYEELVRLGAHLFQNAEIMGQYFEIIRGNPLDKTLRRLTLEEVRRIHRQLMVVHEAHAERLFAGASPAWRFFAKMYYLGTLKLHFDIHEQCFEGPQPWPMPCTAGQTTMVIDHNGEFRACEMRRAVGRLQDFDFNLSAALQSPQMLAEVKAIPEANCWCTHSCWITESKKFSPKVLLFHVPWSYLKHRIARMPEMSVEDFRQFHAAEESSLASH